MIPKNTEGILYTRHLHHSRHGLCYFAAIGSVTLVHGIGLLIGRDEGSLRVRRADFVLARLVGDDNQHKEDDLDDEENDEAVAAALEKKSEGGHNQGKEGVLRLRARRLAGEGAVSTQHIGETVQAAEAEILFQVGVQGLQVLVVLQERQYALTRGNEELLVVGVGEIAEGRDEGSEDIAHSHHTNDPQKNQDLDNQILGVNSESNRYRNVPSSAELRAHEHEEHAQETNPHGIPRNATGNTPAETHTWSAPFRPQSFAPSSTG